MSIVNSVLATLAVVAVGALPANAAPAPTAPSATQAVTSAAKPAATPAAVRTHKLPWKIDTTRAGILRGGSATPYVKLTFDDDGTYAATKRIITTLNKYRVKGIFYRTTKVSAVNNLIVNSGHVLASHTSPHKPMPGTWAAAYKRVLAGATPNSTPKMVRFPGGSRSFDKWLVNGLARKGWQVSYWTVDTNDWRGLSASAICNAAVRGDKRTPRTTAGGNVLMHSRGNTPGAVECIIKGLRGRGLKLLPK